MAVLYFDAVDNKPNKEDLNREAERVAYLIAAFLLETITPEEHDELDAWVVASEDNVRLFEELTDPVYVDWMYQTIRERLERDN